MTTESIDAAPIEGRWPRPAWSAVAAGVVVAGVVLFLVWVMTQPVTVVNDLDQDVTLTGCIDAQALSRTAAAERRFQQVPIAAGEHLSIKTPRGACTVYAGDNIILGCLQFSGWPQREGRLSQVKPLAGVTGIHWVTDETQPCPTDDGS